MTFLDRYTLEQKLIAANGLLLATVLACAALMMFHRREVPAEPPIDQIALALESVAENTPIPDKVLGEGEKFGGQPVFDTIIPIPTPTPSPTPSPVPDAPLAEVIQPWKVNGIGTDSVFLTDTRTRKEWTMFVGNEEVVRFGNVDVPVKLKKIDLMEFKAVFSFQGAQGEQTVSRGMFDE